MDFSVTAHLSIDICVCLFEKVITAGWLDTSSLVDMVGLLMLRAGRPRNRDSKPPLTRVFFSSPKRSDRMWAHPVIYSMGAVTFFFSGYKPAGA
jgi:hypothetical protein